MRPSTYLLAMVFTAVTLSAGCAGSERLSVSMASINREYGELQNEALLLNILRRSVSLPAHFTSLAVIRGRSRITAGTDLTVPFGADAPAQFDFRPHLSIDQGLTMESAALVENFGTPLRMQQSPSLDQLLSVHKEGLEVQKANAAHYQLMKLSETARFCFNKPHEPLLEKARCHTGLDNRFAIDDPTFFGSTSGARVVFSPEGMGTIEMYTRSLAELLSYLGEIVRAQQTHKARFTVRTGTGPQPILVVLPEPQLGPAIVATEFSGTLYGIPAGPENGQSGTVLSIIAQLMAQAQSVKDNPISNTVTIVGN